MDGSRSLEVVMFRFAAVAVLLSSLALAPTARAADAPTRGPRASVYAAVVDAQSKILDLARAMPDAKYDWRPGKGVRSAGEVYRHVAQGNYFLPTFLGIKVPEGTALKDLDTKPMDKAQTVALVERSFAHALDAIAQTSDAALADSVQLFGQPSTRMDVLMVLATHAHEHLGQSIAYARSNDLVPPWTAREEAAAAARAKAK
jgi:uncharacterized damage-inducible protein DinB